MIACYGWTNTLLLNLTNLKYSRFADTPGDLYVLRTARISPALVKAIADSGIFRRVHYIEGTAVDRLDARSAWQNLSLLLRVREERAHFCRQLAGLMPKEGYTDFFCGALWAHTLHLYECFARANAALHIGFVEEGYANYISVKNLCKTLLCGVRKEKLYRLLHFPKTYPKAVKALQGMFLYAPQAYQGGDDVLLHALAPIDTADPVWEKILRDAAKEADTSAYQARPVCYYADPAERGLADTVLSSILRRLPPCEVIYKRHPQTTLDPPLPEGIYIDKRAYCAEALFAVLSMEDKLLVTSHSSAVTYPKRMFDKEPRILFTYGLYGGSMAEDEELERFAQGLRMQYRQSARVMIPRSQEALDELLKQFAHEKLI